MRIIAGTFRSRHLKSPLGTDTRPTSDRTREGIFSVLGSVKGLRVLDLYAGTGALGLEAISRGAAHAVFVESGHRALSCLVDNLSMLGLSGCTRPLHRTVRRARNEIMKFAPFDLIFCDPPWRDVISVWQLLDEMEAAAWLSIEGRLVFEHPASSSPSMSPIADLQVVCVRAWGDSAVTILNREPKPHEPEHPTTGATRSTRAATSLRL